ncbi:hypothetical protein [Robiginitalea sediminis]|nr:hypothetical protein [Robiginitalea sediminis]
MLQEILQDDTQRSIRYLSLARTRVQFLQNHNPEATQDPRG